MNVVPIHLIGLQSLLENFVKVAVSKLSKESIHVSKKVCPNVILMIFLFMLEFLKEELNDRKRKKYFSFFIATTCMFDNFHLLFWWKKLKC